MAKQQVQTKSKVNPINNIGRLLGALRYSERTALRDTAKEIGISAATLLRIEKGYMPDGDTWTKLMAWIMGIKTPVSGRRSISGETSSSRTTEAG